MPSRKNKKGQKRSKQNRKNEETPHILQIHNALVNPDLATLRDLARKGNGFENDNIRRKAWPALLRCANLEDERDLPEKEHPDERQLILDIDRSLNNYPSVIQESTKAEKRKELNNIIVEILRRNPALHYYQGFHDICSVFLLTLRPKHAAPAAENVALFFLRYTDAMLDSLDPILRQLELVNTLLKQEDTTVWEFMERAGVMPYYCLSWVITWYSHDLDDFRMVTRLFDFFIASQPLMPVYFAAVVVMSRRKELLEQECDPAQVHTFITKIPQDLDVNGLVEKAVKLEAKYPPERLQKLGGWLDESSTVNTYESLWLSLPVEQRPPTTKANEILVIPPTERKPFKSREESLAYKNRALITILAAGGVFGAVIFMVGNEMLREWITSGYPV